MQHINHQTGPGLRRGLLIALFGGVSIGVGYPTLAQLERSDGIDVAEDAEEPAVEGEESTEIVLPEVNSVPGFELPVADELVQEQITDFNNALRDQDWGAAFRVLSELGDNQLQAMVPVSSEGEFVAVKEQLQRQLMNLPLDGRRAFRQYYDGQAREMLAAVRSHPMPGSDEQLGLAQALVDRLLATTVGGEAATLLGDMYFERGVFTRAEACWAMALEHDQVSGARALELQVKRVLAMQRGGEHTAAQTLYGQLQARYNEATISVGGNEVDAMQLLAAALEAQGVEGIQTENQQYAMLPEAEAAPAWNLRFLSEANAQRILQSNQQQYNWYYAQGPNDIIRYVPDVVADSERVYFQWLGVVFALDRDSGKILWQEGSMRQTSDTIQPRRLNASGDPRNYRIALTHDALLVTTATMQSESDRFVLTAYDPETGRPLWNSTAAEGWPVLGIGGVYDGVSVLGDVLVQGDHAYAVVRPSQGADCYLRRFNPTTGEVHWTLMLGTGDTITYQYTQIRRMPQPRMVMGEVMLYVMTNNGMLLAVDIASPEIRWALRTDTPYGVGAQENNRSHRVDHSTPHNAVNANGADGLFLHNGVLYLKEHNTSRMYAVDPDTGDLRWEARTEPGVRLVGVHGEHVFAMNQQLYAFAAESGESSEAWNGRQSMRGSDQSAATLVGDRVLVMSDGQLELVNPESRRSQQQFASRYLGDNGGHLYRFDDLIVCISRTDITAFRLPPSTDE